MEAINIKNLSVDQFNLAVSIAEACHEANRALQKLLGEPVNKAWKLETCELKASVLEGVVAAWSGQWPEGLHKSWVAGKLANGWTFGSTKDFDAKTHPCLVEYSKLPESQKVKDKIFHLVVQAGNDQLAMLKPLPELDKN